MTVSDLIEILRGENQNARVMVDGYEYGYEDLQHEQIKTRRIALNVNRPSYGGPHDELDGKYFARKNGCYMKSKNQNTMNWSRKVLSVSGRNERSQHKTQCVDDAHVAAMSETSGASCATGAEPNTCWRPGCSCSR